ncbi:MAG: nucleotide exchange factor GrpE [Actinomycetota bacterium]
MTSARKPAGAPDGWEERQRAGGPGEEQVGEAAGQEEAAVDGLLPDSGKNPSHEVESESAAAVDADFDALLADVQRERDEYLEIAQRARADFENYRKRAARETQEAERRGKAGLAKELVPALDNLERALRAAGIDPETGSPSVDAGEAPSEEVSAHEALARGVALVYGELRAALARAGVETYDPTGEKFDPATCEALSVQAGGDGVDPGVVIETIEKGYRLDGQVLRAARVVVSE